MPKNDLNTYIEKLRDIIVNPPLENFKVPYGIKGLYGELLVLQRLIAEGTDAVYKGGQSHWDIDLPNDEIFIDVKTSPPKVEYKDVKAWGWPLKPKRKKVIFACLAFNEAFDINKIYLVNSEDIEQFKFDSVLPQFKNVDYAFNIPYSDAELKKCEHDEFGKYLKRNIELINKGIITTLDNQNSLIESLRALS